MMTGDKSRNTNENHWGGWVTNVIPVYSMGEWDGVSINMKDQLLKWKFTAELKWREN